MKWKYSVAKDAIISPKTWNSVPTIMSVLGPYLSKSMPTIGPKANRKKIWSDGIHAIVLLE